ncbi:hypothetical protein [Paenibacillus odorifer]|uniref:hypothetical protein n=1 Tax=Paenibacillus odorifer TaxID=189426 RepID=UPI001140ADAD|nr:hypothetical protein [Paenibacillus odorifer]
MLATMYTSASMSLLTTALASESMLVAASGSASVLARQYSIRVGVGFSVESVLESLSVLATMSTSASMSLLAIASTSATASTSTSAQKALSDTADLIRDINPLLGFYRTPKPLLARKAPIISIFLMNSCIGVRN